jgi:DNA-binding transcriptional LysR family regulator
MRFNKVDLNLFVAFDVIYTERNLTRAAEVLCITQPAVSNALSRLRKTFNDQLFVRTPQAMIPTPVADNIIGKVREALQLLNISVQEGDVFEPKVAEKNFQLSMSDLAESLMLPTLFEYLQLQSPNITLSSYPVSRLEVVKEFTSGTLDFCIDVPLLKDKNLCHRSLVAWPYVCVVRHEHPMVGDTLTIEQYLKLQHIHISSRRKGYGHVDMALNRLGLQRKVQLRVKNYLATPDIVKCTDLALTIPLSLAQKFDLKIIALPFEVEKLEWHLYWHKSADRDQANRWLRESIFAWAKESELIEI